ncbi:signal peptide peptidase SppA [Microvenator marinus]|uniref:Signal peptide peptidase SppA n=1 Tax=Microvenator marinus TaxID=2600177 RepID=A0A5B8XK98_9DELT|nr:signal peptide peptidase SppA [Microvenator marinus]QED25964.1 signal peptide peptidase SppA [Microvenator marinus]
MSESTKGKGIVSVLLVFGAMFLMFFLFSATILVASGDGMDFSDANIGVVEINGPIMESKDVVARLQKLAKDETIKGIVVRVDSPGGAVAPSQEMYQAVKRASEKKPLAVSMGSTAASGGYYLALGATKIFANSGSVTGSIGVITQLFNVSKLVEKVDVEIHTVKTGEYKDSGSPFREFDDTDEAYFRQLIDDIYDQFITDVAEARKLDKEKVREVADGRVFTGRQAKELKLVDELGTFDDAVNWVAKEAKIEGEPKLAYPVIETSFLAELLKDGVKGAVSEAKIQSTPVIEYRYVGPF